MYSFRLSTAGGSGSRQKIRSTSFCPNASAGSGSIAVQEEEEKRQGELENKLVTFVSKMKKAELQQVLLELLYDGPEWQYEKFLHEHWIE